MNQPWKTNPDRTSIKETPILGYTDYQRFSKLLLDRCGLYFSEKRHTELELAIRQAFAASTCTNLNEYYQLIQDPRGAIELDRLINAVTISETHFFRDAAQFDALFYHVLPQIIEHRRELRTLRIWSAGCASGEEPYSIAILLRELLPEVDDWAITILGTDINTGALDRARKAVYGDWAFREERAKQWRPHYFTQNGARYELRPEVRKMVTFDPLNLAEPCYPSSQTNTTCLDLIICRNVTIYFSEYVTQEVVERFFNALIDGGWLVVGHSEPSLNTYRRFQVRNFPHTILYQRVNQPTVMPVDWNWSPIPIDRREEIALPPPPETISAPPTLAAPQPSLAAPTPAPLPENSLEHAAELLEYGHAEEARDLLLKWIATQPLQVQACTLLGQAYANLGCWPEAESWCKRAISLHKLALPAYYTLALVLQHQGQLTQAIEAMRKVIYIDHTNVLGHFGLAHLYRENNQLAPAQKSLDNARRLLESHANEELIQDSGGITVGRLRDAIIRQQQAWSIEP